MLAVLLRYLTGFTQATAIAMCLLPNRPKLLKTLCNAKRRPSGPMFMNVRGAAKNLSPTIHDGKLAEDPKYLGAQPGFISILHTWGQNLHFHPHIHTVVLAGGLNRLRQWRNSSQNFFIPVKVLSKKFRGKYLYYLKDYYRKNLLEFYGTVEALAAPGNFQKLLDQCYATNWYSYIKETFSGPRAVIKYLGRYTHRIAISDKRILSIDDNNVTIAVKDYRAGRRKGTVTLSGVEFIRRFLMHILPRGFVKVRHYGLLANRNKKTKLSLCRRLTKSPPYKPRFEGLTTIEIVSLLVGRDVTICPVCQRSRLKKALSPCLGLSP